MVQALGVIPQFLLCCGEWQGVLAAGRCSAIAYGGHMLWANALTVVAKRRQCGCW